MITPSDFRRFFGPAEKRSPTGEESGTGCTASFLGATALAAAVFGASLGITRCGVSKEDAAQSSSARAPDSPDQASKSETADDSL